MSDRVPERPGSASAGPAAAAGGSGNPTAGPALRVPRRSGAKAGAPPSWLKPEIWLTLVLVVLDQLTKLMVLQRIQLHETVPVIPGLLNLTYVRNTGAAFGMLNASDFAYKSVVVAGLALVALLGILWYARRFAGDAWPARYGFVLIVAGALGNLIDRVTLGYVVDFVDVYAGTWHFWAFNVADAAITIGAILFAADTLFSRPHVPEAA